VNAIPPANSRVALGTALLRTMHRIRQFELQAGAVQKAGEIPGVLHLSIGQEGVAAGVCAALTQRDFVASTHRGHGHAIAKGADVAAMMAELYGRAAGTCAGKGGSMHIADFASGMLGANGVVAGSIGIAVGAAQGLRLQRRDAVVACFFGDGAVNRGPFLEGLNWAQLFRLPVLFVCEDNGFAAFTRAADTTAGDGAAARAAGIGLAARTVDGNDAFAVHDAATELVAACRAGQGPAFIHARTYRLDGHTVADTAPYRGADEVAGARARDPVLRMIGALGGFGVEAAGLAAIERAAAAEIEAAIVRARTLPEPELEAAFADVQDVGAPR